jgi:hypothetical protein
MITTQEWTKNELDTAMDVAMDLKRKRALGEQHPYLDNKASSGPCPTPATPSTPPTSVSCTSTATARAWVEAGKFKHPAMFGFGPGIEQNTHKIGECVDQRELRLAVAFLARFPSAYAAGDG